MRAVLSPMETVPLVLYVPVLYAREPWILNVMQNMLFWFGVTFKNLYSYISFYGRNSAEGGRIAQTVRALR